MTEDPKRLSDGGGDELERDLLASVRHAGPPDGARDAAWSGIAAQLAVGAAAGAAVTASAATAKAGAGALLPGAIATKAALALAAGGVAVGGYLAAQRAFDREVPADTHAPRPALTAAAPLQAPAANAEVPAAEPVAPTEAAQVPTRPELPHAAEPKRSAALAAESALLAQTRARLRAGDTRGAQAALVRLQARFPHGQLGQEREVLAIELLSAQGNAREAARRARAFVTAHPGSPHSATLSRFLDRR